MLIVLFPNFIMMIASRCIQGIGATMIMANSQAMVRQVFPNNERGKALGINAIIISLGTLSGPAIGGILLEYTGWPGLFLINVPLGIVAMFAGFRLFPKVQSLIKDGLDLLGSVLLASSVLLLLLGTTEFQQQGDVNYYVIITLLSGVFLLIVLFISQKKMKNGILDKELFADRIIVIGNASGFFIHLAQMATLIPITFYMQEVLGYSTWKMGIILSLQPLFMGITAPFSGWYRDRFGATFPLLLGPLLCSISMYLIVFTNEISLFNISFHLAIFGAGTGFFQAINNAEIMSATPDAKISLSGSMLALIRYLGMIVGIGLATTFAGKLGSTSGFNQFTMSIKYLFGISSILCLAVSGFSLLRLEKNSLSKGKY